MIPEWFFLLILIVVIIVVGCILLHAIRKQDKGSRRKNTRVAQFNERCDNNVPCDLGLTCTTSQFPTDSSNGQVCKRNNGVECINRFDCASGSFCAGGVCEGLPFTRDWHLHNAKLDLPLGARPLAVVNNLSLVGCEERCDATTGCEAFTFYPASGQYNTDATGPYKCELFDHDAATSGLVPVENERFVTTGILFVPTP